MRVLCRHGHFAFYPRNASDIAQFANYFDITLKRERDYYTFEGLYGADDYSLTLSPYLNMPALVTYEGEPWEVMRENMFVYHLGLDIVVPRMLITTTVEVPLVGFYFTAQGSLLQPGSWTSNGQIMSYVLQWGVCGRRIKSADLGVCL
jgi:putative methionine-R-sulfoxide reductase with GAF domain